jgi:pyridoxal phosphate enzyme (YggS family)
MLKSTGYFKMQDIFDTILGQLSPYRARLVAVSKTKPDSAVMALYSRGQRKFGENKVQELAPKYERLPKDIEWHMIGHLQRNKVRYIAPFVAMIESVDSLELLLEINKQGLKCDRAIPCLLQFHIAREETKFGLSLEEATAILRSEDYRKCRNVQVAGVMGMASFTENEAQVRQEFSQLREIFQTLKAGFFPDDPAFCEISMGMSSDYPVALEEGATLVRIGTLLFDGLSTK